MFPYPKGLRGPSAEVYMRLKALLLPVLVLSAGCSQLVETFDPPTVLQARVTAQSTPVTVQDVGEYPVG